MQIRVAIGVPVALAAHSLSLILGCASVPAPLHPVAGSVLPSYPPEAAAPFLAIWRTAPNAARDGWHPRKL
ncbi:hypothetical protein T484DRAFT_1964602 [Baffinella frigidus]|nr:hypothetical protein T484DRAFT_1964602 [Cryptophyta sp. CCMP2293]